MEKEETKYKDTVTLRFSNANKPLYSIYKRFAQKEGISPNKLMERVLVAYMTNKRGVSWDEPDQDYDPAQMEIDVKQG